MGKGFDEVCIVVLFAYMKWLQGVSWIENILKLNRNYFNHSLAAFGKSIIQTHSVNMQLHEVIRLSLIHISTYPGRNG